MPAPRAPFFAAFAAALSVLPTAALAEVPQVVATVKPLHSLAAAVMRGVGEPELLLPPGASPHDYALKPSDARALDEADVVFWVGAPLETFLKKPVQSLAADARVVALASTPGLTLLPTRTGGAWEAHAHDHGDEHEHEHEHAHEGVHDDGHDHGDEHGHDHERGHEHAEEHHGEDDHLIAPMAALDADAAELPANTDSHIWLDPRNAAAMAAAMAEVLAEADPANAATYRANAEALRGRLAALEDELSASLARAGGVPYVVFHDAYHYLEHRFGLTPVGSITVEPGRPVGARRVAELREKVSDLNAACVFAEPQFEPRLVTTITEGTDARTGILDPLGSDIPAGPEHYAQTMRAMAGSLAGCLAPQG